MGSQRSEPSSAAPPQPDPLDRAIVQWYASVSPGLAMRLKRGLVRQGACKRLTYGTIFSGSDIVAKVIGRLQDMWRTSWGPGMAKTEYTCLFQCELNKQKREWLIEQFPTGGLLFEDAASLSLPRARDERSGEYHPIPAVDMVFAGFSCKSRSKANNSRSAFKHCVQSGTGETGTTFGYVQQYLERKRPRFVFLENVEELAEGGQDSDLSFILSWLRGVGYTSDGFNNEARDYGSYCRRARLYIVAWRGSDASKTEVARAFLAETASKAEQPNVFDFLDPPSVANTRQVVAWEGSASRSQGQSDKDHADWFVEAGWVWPLSQDRFVAEFGTGMLHLTQRAREVVWLAHFKWPMPSEARAALGLFKLRLRLWISCVV